MGFFEKGILLYLLLAVAISLWQPSIIFDGSTSQADTPLGWFNVKLNTTNNEVYYDTGDGYNVTGDVQTGINEALRVDRIPQGTNFLTFLDPIFKVLSFLAVVIKILFAPIIIFTKPQFTGLPMSFMLIFVIPLVALVLISILKWIRNGE